MSVLGSVNAASGGRITSTGRITRCLRAMKTYLVVQKHKDKKDQRLVYHVIEDEHGSIDNARVEIEEVDVIDTVCKPLKELKECKFI